MTKETLYKANKLNEDIYLCNNIIMDADKIDSLGFNVVLHDNTLRKLPTELKNKIITLVREYKIELENQLSNL